MHTQIDRTPSKSALVTNTIMGWIGNLGKDTLTISCFIALWGIIASITYFGISSLLKYLS